MNCEHEDKVFSVHNAQFEALALHIFQFQYQHNPLYQQYVQALGIVGPNVQKLTDIPFLPISFFKSHEIKTTSFPAEAVFESSGTTGMLPSRHFVKKLALYRSSFLLAFEQFYGRVADWCIIGLLPSYLERQHSSLVVMTDELIRRSGHADSGFYLYEHAKLQQVLQRLEKAGQKVLLIGVTFALLDFAVAHPMPLHHTIVMETGGMKGRREEMTREEVHELLKQAFHLDVVHSEYGMTELLSQGYSAGHSIFQSPPWMKVLVRQEDDPLEVRTSGTGIVNVIDLANIYSCSFIATDDVGRVEPDGSFTIQGRMDNSDIRGCSLLVADIKND